MASDEGFGAEARRDATVQDQKSEGVCFFREGARVLGLQKSGFCVLRSILESDL